jgi:hypothetical protein
MINKCISVFILIQLSVVCSYANLRISRAVCENKVNPAGVGLQNIRFGWEAESDENGQSQTAYQLVIASSKEKLQAGNYDVSNPGIVKSKQSVLVKYNGKPLNPAQTYYWKLRVWDAKNRVGEWSETQQFTTGLFSAADWKGAKWIGYEDLPDSMRVAPGVHQPDAQSLGNKAMQRPVIPLFRKAFTVNKKVKSALLFVTGLGQYEVSINGAKVGNSFFAPGWTYYDKTILYNIYDVSEKVKQGSNALGAMVGNGFYNINRERYFKIISVFGMPTMICNLKITYDDGSSENIVTDKSWKTAASPITFTSIFGGEDYDAQLEQDQWNTPLFNDGKWKQALQVKEPLGKLLPEQDYPIQLLDSFTVKKVWQPKAGSYIYDFGQNASGIIELRIKGKKGQTVKLTPGELLNSEQLPNQKASGDPYYFSYTLKSDNEEVWRPKFT